MSSIVIASLSKVGALVAQAIRNKATALRVPDVSKSTSVKEAKIDRQLAGGGVEAHVSIVIDTSEDGAPAARAYEWGSGERATMGIKQRITIPKPYSPSKILSFPKEDWPDYDPNFFGDGRPGPAPNWFHFMSVSHPGVFPRPYIKPSIVETKSQVLKIVGQSIKAELLVGTKKIEEIILK